MPEDVARPHVRVFLSVDLVGSTGLKNRRNHQELLAGFRAHHHVVARLRACGALPEGNGEAIDAAFLESLGVGMDDFDWATIVCSFFSGIHSEFSAALSALGRGLPQPGPWKAIGDELIYQLEVSSREQLHWILVAFLTALRQLNGKLDPPRPDGGPRLGVSVKGAAWIAGFPVRNRIIEIPAIGLLDYLGPDIDTGFRVAKFTRAGMLVVTVEVAELIAESEGNWEPMVGTVVGWEKLKDVWNNHLYPIIWVDYPKSLDRPRDVDPFTPWQRAECPLCESWEQEPRRSLPLLLPELHQLRDGLSHSLGLVDPYITGDPLQKKPPSEDHQAIRDLLVAISAHRAASLRQNALPPPTEPANIDGDIKQAEDLVEPDPAAQPKKVD